MLLTLPSIGSAQTCTVYCPDGSRPRVDCDSNSDPCSSSSGSRNSSPGYDYGAAQRAQAAEAERLERERRAIATGRCERDLSTDLRGALAPHRGKHQAAITPEELPDLLRAIDGYAELGDRLTSLALRLLALTFVRTGELIGAQWKEFGLDSAAWIIPALQKPHNQQRTNVLVSPPA